jgi:hypothetical protein
LILIINVLLFASLKKININIYLLLLYFFKNIIYIIMAFTRFHDDPCRITKQLQQQTDQGRWVLDVPGNGDKPCFALDPQIIPQKWGGNLWTHSIDIQSALLGIDKRINRDIPNTVNCLKNSSENPYKRFTVNAAPISYPVCDTFITTEQSRAIMPAWTARDLQQNHAYILPDNPQAHTEMKVPTYIDTRILEKNNFKRGFECVPLNDQGYTVPVKQFASGQKTRGTYVGGSTTCASRDSCNKV